MTTQITKWGNSYAIRIPKGMLIDSGLEQGSLVNIIPEKGGLVLRPAKKRGKFTLKGLLKGMKKENFHEYVDWGKPVGKEIW